ncbi:MAG TPA: phosphatase PAP2 family protein [Methanobacterium sp.]|nr:phosphatase PAP2 family protein [Methanobacterium sp.]
MISMLEPLITINNFDTQIFYLINLNMQNPVFDFIMPLISQVGYFSFWIIISILIFIFGGEKGRKVAVLSILALITGYFLTEILKFIVARPRPFDVLGGVRVLAPIGDYSWPSGHSVASFTVATIIGKEYGLIYFIIFIIFAGLVAFSRVYNGVHYPSDVISGALIGILIGLVFLRYKNEIMNGFKGLENKLKKKI